MEIEQFEGRKRDHIRYALDPVNQAVGLSGLDRIHLHHEALPEIGFEDVRLESICLGQSLKTPYYVAGMTAGHPDAFAINLTLGQACEERGWAMGVGSQRREFEALDSATIDLWQTFRKEAPRLTLFANIGISQVIDAPISKLLDLVITLKAQALAVHLNALQEILQPEGTPRFKGGLLALKELSRELKDAGIPLVLKETGCGFSASTLNRLAETGLAAVDVSGLGGTHWGRIEGARAERATVQSVAAATFANWGEPTASSVLAARRVFEKSPTEIWASGGVRTGLDAAKLIALGAHRVGFAKPALEAALAGPEALRLWMEAREYELKVALFCTGSVTPTALREKDGAWKQSGF